MRPDVSGTRQPVFGERLAVFVTCVCYLDVNEECVSVNVFQKSAGWRGGRCGVSFLSR